MHEFNCLIPTRASALRGNVTLQKSQVLNNGERLDRGNTRGYQVFHNSIPPRVFLFLSFFLFTLVVVLSERWNSGYNVSRRLIIRISNREIAIYSWSTRRAERRGEERRGDANARKREKSESEKRGERLGAGRITIWPPRIHYEQNYEVIAALAAKMRRLYTNANECECF